MWVRILPASLSRWRRGREKAEEAFQVGGMAVCRSCMGLGVG